MSNLLAHTQNALLHLSIVDTISRNSITMLEKRLILLGEVPQTPGRLFADTGGMILPRVNRRNTTIAATYIKHVEVYNLYEHLPNGIFNTGTATLEIANSTLDHNLALDEGGGLWNSGSVTVNNSTFTGNSASDGGGISNDGIITISNSTISGNSASGKSSLAILASGKVNNYGGGIYNRGTITLASSTLTLNWAANGGGVFNDPGYPYFNPGIANVQNTIITSNLLNQNGINPDVSGTFTSNGDNLIGDPTGSSGFDALEDIVGTSDNPITLA